jgi:hypothetical protein
MEKLKNAYKSFVNTTCGRKPFERPRPDWKYNIKADLSKQIECEVHLTLSRQGLMADFL